MKKVIRLLCLVLAFVLCLGLVACGPKDNNGDETGNDTTPVDTDNTQTEVFELPNIEGIEDYNEVSEILYNYVLGEYLEAYNASKETTNIAERYALMAVAEAKLLESGVMLPLTSRGGNYAISRVAPYTVTPVLWGNDSDRFHQALVVDGDPITAADRTEMKAKYSELKGTGTWEAWAKEYLAGKGYTLTSTYALGYSSDPQTWDAVATSRAADSEAIVNTYDGLYEYDIEGVLQPALATSYDVTTNEDGQEIYTFHLREGVKWVDSQGREIGNVTADDFVAAMQHMMDAMGGLEYLVDGIIVGAHAYINGETSDFAEVGVKAVDELTLEYTLEAPCSYFTTMLSYNIFAPMSRAFYESKGGKFGEEYDASLDSYTYGKTKDDIAYCGPYLVSNATEKNTIVFNANPSYWNKDNINCTSLVWLFNDGTDVTKAYNDMKAGTLAGAGLNDSTVVTAKEDGMFDTYAYISSTDATSFMAFNNINRAIFANVNNAEQAVSPKDEDAQARTWKAMLNKHFRNALAFSVDRPSYNAQSVGEELKLTSLRNTYTPGTFVTLPEAVTIQINGKDTTFAAGTNYGAILQAQLDADKSTIKAYDPAADDGVGSSDGFDGWFNADQAVAELNLAIEQLATVGVEVSAENPIYIDLPAFTGSASYQNRANVYKQSVEGTLGGKVIVNLIDCPTSAEWYYAGYYTDYGYEANYDVYDVSGWGPDYGDPSTYLDTFLPDYSGYMVKCIGVY